MENKIKGENFLNWSVNVETLLNKSLKTQHNYLTLYKQQIPGYLLGKHKKSPVLAKPLTCFFQSENSSGESKKFQETLF